MAISLGFFSRNLFINILFSYVLINADEFYVLSSPSYLKFTPTDANLKTSQLAQLSSILLGFSADQNFGWDGLKAVNPFHHPEGLVLLDIPKLEVWPELTGGYKIDNDIPAIDLSSVVNQLEHTFTSPVIIDADSKQKLLSIQMELAMESKPNFNETLENELQTMESIIDILSSKKPSVRDGVPDIFHFHLSGIQDIVKINGMSSQEVKKAQYLLKTSISKIQKTLEDLYDGDIIFILISIKDAEKLVSRKSRSLLAFPENNNLNLAPSYSQNYAVIFNLLLWTMIMLSITVLSITVFIWHMDPGRDSIIYRMTSQRMKKD